MLVSGGSLALYGLVRLIFNAVGVRVFGAAYVGTVAAGLAYSSVAAVLLSAIPGVLGARFVSQYRGAGDLVRASRLFTAVVCGTFGVAAVIAVALGMTGRPTGSPVLAAYVLAFSLYLLFRSTYFAFGLTVPYARAEALAFTAFGVVFGVGCASRSESWATMSMLVHPLTVVALACWDHRAYWKLDGAFAELAQDQVGYARFAASTLANALNGLASYHLLLVIASWRLDATATGHLSVLLSALSPFSLLPVAFGSAAFPELARRFGGGDHAGITRLIRRSTIVLQGAVLAFMSPFVIASGPMLALLGLPPDVALQGTWGWMLLSLALNCISAPCGHFLNATEHVHKHALLSIVTLILGTWVGLGAITAYGVLGAGLMRFAVDGTMAWARIALAERLAPWMRGATVWLLAGHATLLAVFAAAILLRSLPVALSAWIVAMSVQAVWGRRVLARA